MNTQKTIVSSFIRIEVNSILRIVVERQKIGFDVVFNPPLTENFDASFRVEFDIEDSQFKILTFLTFKR